MGLSRILVLSIPLISFWGLNTKVNKFHSMASHPGLPLLTQRGRERHFLETAASGGPLQRWTAACQGLAKHTGSGRAQGRIHRLGALQPQRSGFKWRWPDAKCTAELSGLILEGISNEEGRDAKLAGLFLLSARG